MGLFDNVGGMISSLIGGGAGGQTDSAALVSSGLSKAGIGDMDGLVSQLQQNGLGAEVQSWLSGGSNMPISAQQVQAALGNEQVKALAEHFGLPVDAALNLLAQHIPNAVAQTNGTDGSTTQSA